LFPFWKPFKPFYALNIRSMKELLWKNIVAVRERSPLVHSITNYVVMNTTANALLAAGASPIMAHAHPEMEDLVSISGALVINIGTLDEYWVKSMHLAIARANQLKKPWVLDPVGAGASAYRNEVLESLVQLRPSVIRGNASEIMALAKKHATTTKGVDSTNQSNEAIEAAQILNSHFGSVVCISGATDIVIDRQQTIRLSNGHPLMARVTGLGCTATALTGAFVAVQPANLIEATASAMALLGVVGELAAERANGPGTLQLNILDLLHTFSQEAFLARVKVAAS
jgi:hydroxyethylthiazole kinase